MNLSKNSMVWMPLYLLLPSCASAGLEDVADECVSASWDANKDEFGAVFDELAAEFGGDKEGLFSATCGGDPQKADLFDFLPEPCELLAPLVEIGEDGMRSGFVIGIQGDEVLGAIVGFGGYELVWDLYHQQMTVARYAGAGIGVPGAGASAQAYVGAAFGFDHGVSDWNGYSVTTNLEIGLPFLKNFVELNPSFYMGAQDEDGNEFVDPTEILLPPDGVYGFTIGVSLGFSLMPEVSPVSGSVTEGYSQPYKKGIRHYYETFRNTKMGFVEPMKVRLVDQSDGAECHEDWPEVDGERNCVIEFGDPNESYLRRSVNTAYSICHATGRCAVPLTWPMSGTAIAIAALRSSGLSFSSFCPDHAMLDN